MKKQLVSYFTILTSFLLLFVVALIVSFFFLGQPQLNKDELSKTFAASINDFSPEPNERWIFVINTLLAPVMCGGFYLFFTRLVKKESAAKIKMLYWVISPMFLFLLGYLAVLGLQFASFNYIRTSGFVQYPWITLISNLGIFAVLLKYRNTVLKKEKLAKLFIPILYWSMGCFILLLAGMETVFNDYDPYVPHIHFLAYFDSVAQVLLGKHLFLDFSPQYGAYAWLLKPIFQGIGLDVLKFTITMGILKIIVFGSLLVLLYKVLNNKLIAFLSFSTLFFYTRMREPIDILKAPDYQYHPQSINYPGLLDPYFQYNPHRMLFPVLLIFLAWFYITSKNVRTRKLLYFVNGFLSALATLWNPDTGLVVTLAWLGLLAYQEIVGFEKDRLVKIFLSFGGHVCILILAYGLVFGSFALSEYLETGFLPSFANSADYTSAFYFSGLFMMPMPVIHPWNMVILAYLVGLYFPVRALVKSFGKSHPYAKETLSINYEINQFIFMITLIGIGLFNYYVGRSHDYNLIATVWPGYILLAIFVERLSRRILPIFRSRLFDWKIKVYLSLKNSFQLGLFIGLFFFLGSSLTSIAGNLPAYLALINQRMSLVQRGMPPDLASEVQFIQETSDLGEPVFIISDYAPELYLYTQHTRPVGVVGFGEIILVKDVKQITEFLDNPPRNARLYWDKRFYVINHYMYDLDYHNFPNLALEKISTDTNLILFTPRP
jgi:hypothetical protein